MKNLKTSKSFRKIKINEKKVEVHYIKHVMLEEEDEIRNIQIPMVSDVKPHKDFHDAFQALREQAVAFMELSVFKNKPDAKTLEKYVVTTCSITEDTDTTRIQISMNKYLSNGKCFSVTSPLIDLENEEFDGIIKLSEAYDILIAEAKEYLTGKNGETQMKIIFESVA